MNKQEVVVYIRDKIELLFRKSFSWISNNSVVIGFIIRIFHVMITFTMTILIFISIFFLRFRLITFILLFLIWVQHILLECCILSICEFKLLNDDLLTTITNIFGIPYSTTSIIFLVIETLIVFLLGITLIFH